MECDLELYGMATSIPAIVKAMEDEHAEYYGKPCGAGHGAGLDIGYLWWTWTTSSGNILQIRSTPTGSLVIRVTGRRHGIPWRFLPAEVKERMKKFCVAGDDGTFLMNTNFHRVHIWETLSPSIPPWETNSSRPSQW